MENAADALKMGFAVMVFVIALTVIFSMISQAKQTADIVFEIEDDTKYFSEGLEGVTYLTSGTTERIVGWETVVPTIYRYQKENYGVTIVDSSKIDNPEYYIIARFDTETETIVQNWYSNSYETEKKNHIDYLNNKVFGKNYTIDNWYSIFEKIYNAKSKTNWENVIGAPWLSSNSEDLIKRLNLDLNNPNLEEHEYEYATAIYTGLGLGKDYSQKKFKETIHIIEETQANEEVKQKVEIIYEVQ